MTIFRKTDEIKLASTLPNAEAATQEVRQFIDVHIYDLAPQEEEETQAVETTIAGKAAESVSEPQTGNEGEQTERSGTRRHSHLFIVLVILFVVVMLFGCLTYLLLFLPSVTVTIVPTTKKVQTSNTLILSTHADMPESVPGRMLSPLVMSQSQIQVTTGTTYQPARPGRGTITFYNAALYPQTIVVGTLITGKDGMQVVTDSAVTVPAGTLATNGQAQVSAHSVTTGPDGNIQSGDIYGDCCLLKISAVNGAFTGGTNTETYQSVAKQDIDTAVSSLQKSVTQSVLAALQIQVQNGETLVDPPLCEPNTTTDHQAGDKATQVQVTLSETCTGLTYDTRTFRARISQIQAKNGNLNHYRMLGNTQTLIQSVAQGKESGTYTLTVQTTAIWTYQFTQRELSIIASHVAGMTTRDATQYLLHTAGVQQVSFSSNGTLPSDVNKIHFLFLTQ